jgi:hypothetical protein
VGQPPKCRRSAPHDSPRKERATPHDPTGAGSADRLRASRAIGGPASSLPCRSHNRAGQQPQRALVQLGVHVERRQAMRSRRLRDGRVRDLRQPRDCTESLRPRLREHHVLARPPRWSRASACRDVGNPALSTGPPHTRSALRKTCPAAIEVTSRVAVGARPPRPSRRLHPGHTRGECPPRQRF